MMRYRAEGNDGDYTIGRFLVDSPEAVAQAVRTRMRLFLGEWPLDVEEGTPYYEKVLGAGRKTTFDLALQERILGTPGVVSILAYESQMWYNSRESKVRCTIQTAYGQTDLEVSA